MPYSEGKVAWYLCDSTEVKVLVSIATYTPKEEKKYEFPLQPLAPKIS